MCKFKLNQDKQDIIKFFTGEDFYNNLYWYQKWLIQTQLKDRDVKKFKKMKQYIKEKQKNEEKRNNKI